MTRATYSGWPNIPTDSSSTPRVPKATYMVLHRAGCRTVTAYQGDATDGAFAERQYAEGLLGDRGRHQRMAARTRAPERLAPSKRCSKCVKRRIVWTSSLQPEPVELVGPKQVEEGPIHQSIRFAECSFPIDPWLALTP